MKLISTELTKNTTRVVEMAVKGEVQNSVLPSLENITKTEVKSAVNTHIVKGLGDSMKNVRIRVQQCSAKSNLTMSYRCYPLRSRRCYSSLKFLVK